MADRDKLTFIAAKDEVGDITAIAINKTDDELTLDLTGITLDEAWQYTGNQTITYIANPTLVIPPMSITTYRCSVA